MKKFSEHSGGIQLAQILGVMTFLFGVGGSFMLWAADMKIDEKYATDEDLASVQEVVTLQVETITKSVEENTRTVKATSSSVDGLVLVVLDIQISDLEDQIDSLERDKRNQAAAWNERDERNLRDRQKNLADLGVQRETLFARLINPTP